MAMILTPLPDIPLVQPGDDLVDLIQASLCKTDLTPQDGDIFVIAQKIVSKAENRFVNLAQVNPSEEAVRIANEVGKDPRFVELVLRESQSVLRTRINTLIVVHKLGFVCANAGIDHSNVQGRGGNPEDWVLLLPENPDASAEAIRKGLERLYRARLAVMIIDSHGRAWRLGVVGTTIGISGAPALVDMRGKPDMFGYQLRITQIAAADELAAGASLVMGQANEKSPVVHVRGFPYPLRESGLNELLRPEDQDLFR